MEQAREAAQAVTDFFAGNPFGTSVGHKIEQATDGSLASENWALNIEICDEINMTDEGARDAVRAIRKRLQTQMGKNNTSVMYTLTVLETAVKNCDRRLHNLVAQKDFINELVRLIGPKFDPPQVIQEKVLGLIQAWADAFRANPDLKGVCEVYDDLKSKGVEFPMTDLDSMAPIFTPQKVVSESSPTHQSPQRAVVQAEAVAVALGPVAPTPEQLSKLRSELDIVNGNLRVMREMLSELHPGSEAPDDLQLLTELNNACRAMQERVRGLLLSVANEEVTNELLLVNDELNNVFEKYDRYMKNRDQSSENLQQLDEAAGGQSLIDFGAEKGADLSGQLADMKVSEGAAKSEDFDMFAQTRGSFEQSKQSGSTYEDNSTGLDQIDITLGSVVEQKSQLEGREQDYKEMEAWLQDKPSEEASGTSAEFEAFLAGRAESGQSLPTGGRAVKTKEDEEQKLFAL